MDTPTNDGRDNAGRFAQGNRGGPGRPRRAVELDYLAKLGDALSLEDWAAIVKRAVADAKNGSGQAREWVSRYALGSNPMGLMDLARRELLDVTPGDEMAALNTEEAKQHLFKSIDSTPVFIKAAEDKAQRAELEQDRIEQERRRAKRAAKRKAKRAAKAQAGEMSTTTLEGD